MLLICTSQGSANPLPGSNPIDPISHTLLELVMGWLPWSVQGEASLYPLGRGDALAHHFARSE